MARLSRGREPVSLVRRFLTVSSKNVRSAGNGCDVCCRPATMNGARWGPETPCALALGYGIAEGWVSTQTERQFCRGQKRDHAHAAQDARWVKVYRRNERGAWREQPDVYRDGETFELPRLTHEISIGEIYDGVLDGSGRSLLR
jgi:hypothetical protein